MTRIRELDRFLAELLTNYCHCPSTYLLVQHLDKEGGCKIIKAKKSKNPNFPLLSCQFYKDFPNCNFANEPRSFIYDISINLISEARSEKNDFYDDDRVIKAILLLIFSWNFAALETKALSFNKVKELLKKNAKTIVSLEKFSILDNWDNDPKIEEMIYDIYENFKNVFGQTGASKALSLLNTRLFVMWDTRIREFIKSRNADPNLRINGINNGKERSSYFKYLKGIKCIIQKCNLDKHVERNELAKKIDEYHYSKIIMGNN